MCVIKEFVVTNKIDSVVVSCSYQTGSLVLGLICEESRCISSKYSRSVFVGNIVGANMVMDQQLLLSLAWAAASLIQVFFLGRYFRKPVKNRPLFTEKN